MAKTNKHARIKQRMLIRRQVPNGYTCDLCGEAFPMLDKHEIVNDNRLPLVLGTHMRTARSLAEDEEVSALLCRGCHSKAHTPEIQTHLLMLNIRRLGHTMTRAAAFGAVFMKLTKIEEWAGHDLGITFPKWDAIWSNDDATT